MCKVHVDNINSPLNPGPDVVMERCMCTMQTGTQMTKLKGKKKGLVRFFYLDEHKSCIRWRPSRKHDKAKITIDSIHEVCEGKKSEIFQRYADSCFDPNCCFSIYHGDHVESLDLVSTNGDEARTWITGLKYLMAGISDEDSLAKRQRKRDQYPLLCHYGQTFSEADKNGDGNLSLGEVLQLLHKLNVNLPRQKVREMFKKADTDDNQGSLAFEEFCTFYKMMSTRRGLYLIMLSYSNNKEFMDLNDLVRFMENEQKMAGVTREYCLEIVSQFEPCSQNLQNMVLGIDGFTNYMRSPAGDIFKPDHHRVHQDMTQPLCNYFIASSHNTYLTGDQLLSESRVDMYAYVLQAGCRCVEVDCWDGPDGEPIVHHGYTLTSKILFKDVIETVNKYAFTKNQYPVILSIENHCTVPQQKKMAEYLLEVLQDKVDLSTVNMNEFRKLPSPELLKGKVLVKGKKLPANIDGDAEEGDVLRVKYQCFEKGKTMRLSRALSDLVKYTKSVRVHDIETQAYMTSWQVSSLNESIVNQIMALKPAQLVRLNQRQLLRVYPSNYRVDSSNFNPQPFWNAGCHMVALNYQTEGRMLELNRAKFSTNGNCGYLLKPRCMNKGFFNPTLEDPLPGQSKTQLVLKIISGQQLPKPKDSMLGDRGEIIDPFVEVEIIGLPIDCCKQQTRVVDDNGFNPMWEESLVFTLHMTQIALVRFQVWDHDPIGQNFIGQRTIAFVSMMPGYRHVYLEGMEEASIFVHVAVNDITGKVGLSTGLSFCFTCIAGIFLTASQFTAHFLLNSTLDESMSCFLSRRLSQPRRKGRPRSQRRSPCTSPLTHQRTSVSGTARTWTPTPRRAAGTAAFRRTLETPASQRPSDTSRTKARSRSVPRKQHTSPITPVVNRRAAVHWQPQTPSPPPQNHCRYGHQPIPNGLYLSDSDSSSGGSIDSLRLELMPSRVPVSGQREVGTLQREMNALFDQKMKEIRCKSPLFFYGKCDSYYTISYSVIISQLESMLVLKMYCFFESQSMCTCMLRSSTLQNQC
uniref:Phosphoinositide phospholipase C n=1 Tax=Oncorhynchus mykiss TaxID=8022 RepID=A0A8C7PT14_ONCMY